MAFISDTKEYWEGNKERCKASRALLSPLFSEARDSLTRDVLAVLDSRRYRRIPDPIDRMRAAEKDQKMQQISRNIEKVGVKGLGIILKDQPSVYNTEAPLQAEIWNENTPGWANFEVTPLTKEELREIELQPYLGRTYADWSKINTQDAVKSWDSAFLEVMVGRIQQVGAVEPSVQLVKSGRKTLDTMESRYKTVMENACINTARYINREFILETRVV